MLTSRTNIDVPAFPAKTPGRDPRSRLENTTTVRRRGKNVVFPKTPLHPSSVQSRQLFKDQKSVFGTAARPLGDKTPLPNRLAPLILQSTQKKYETPMNHGNHWDVSNGDIDVSSLQPVPIQGEEDDLGSDEIEFCPPNTLDLTYQPPFDFELPNYTELGKTIRELAFSFPYDDASGPPEPDFLVSELEPIVWEAFPLPLLGSDDPFRLARLESSKASTNKPSSSQKTQLVPLRRAQSSLARLAFPNNGTESRSKPGGPSKNLKTISNPAPVKKQPSKSVSERHPPKVVTTARVMIQKKSTAAAPMRTTQDGPIRPQTRPHTSLSIPSGKGASLAPKSNSNSSNQPLQYQLVGEDFMFDV